MKCRAEAYLFLNRTMVFGLCLMLAGLHSADCSAKPASQELAKVAAPDFTLKASDGRNLRLSEYKGQVLLVNFWASWCGPCRKEMPLLDDLHKRYERMGFSVIGVNLDEEVDAANKVLKDIPVSFPVLFDTKNDVSKAYDVDAMPMTYLIDRDGNMRYLHRGYKGGYEKKYEAQIKSLVRER